MDAAHCSTACPGSYTSVTYSYPHRTYFCTDQPRAVIHNTIKSVLLPLFSDMKGPTDECCLVVMHWINTDPGVLMFAIHFICQTKCSYPSICQQKRNVWRVLGGCGRGGRRVGAHKRLHVSLGDSYSTGLINCAASALRTNAAPSRQNRENLLNPVLNLPWFFCNALCSTQISDKWM